MVVLFYQVVIFGIVIISAFGGRKALNRTAVVLCLWTLTHVFMPWLLAVQFVTIAVAFSVGRCIVRPSKSTAQQTLSADALRRLRG